ncbi:MAG TPA: S-methyl-5-thioribose-1-phosphate isomerase [Desulfobacteraceae bacterium]|nr:S-methyl-5-thioribose-1-phosphate isomerase [Desulfobacteraceae bacterium]
MIDTIRWKDGLVEMVDQRKIPQKIVWYRCRSYRDVIEAIKKMVIRGAPAIGIAGGMALALGARAIRTDSKDRFFKRLNEIADQIIDARPTAVNLRWAVERLLRYSAEISKAEISYIKDALIDESIRLLREDQEINRAIGKNGLSLIPHKATILTHCNAGSLATGGYGTALGVIRAAKEAGKDIEVIADETRPFFQGLRLTAFELMEDQIPVSVIVDSAAGFMIRSGKVDLIITGADRITLNGDVANKIGTYQLAVLAKENGVPFYVAAPISTIDPELRDGNSIPIEFRAPEEVTHVAGKSMAPEGVSAYNPAFDITPSRYVTSIITEKGIIRSPYRKNIEKILKD